MTSYLFIISYSGGWAAGTCSYGVVYALKFVLCGDGSCDNVDIIYSFNYSPKSALFYSLHKTAFTPTTDSVQAAIDGTLTKHIDWCICPISISR